MTDRAALIANRTRAARLGAEMYLHDAAILEIKERLAEVNKPFTDVAVVTGMPAIWQAAFPTARIVPDEELLALEADSFDLVIHAGALHWANDLVGQLIQCRRALHPDGLFIGAMAGGRTLSELRAALAEAEAVVSGGLSARVMPMGEIRDLGALLQRAGFALPVADIAPLTVSFRDIRHLAADLRRMGEGNALAARNTQVGQLRKLFRLADSLYAKHFSDGGSRILATFETVYLTGWAPGPDQQKPLRPGSAAQRLADALGATEMPISDRKIPD